MKKVAQNILEFASERERDVLISYFGLEGKPIHTLEKIGQKYHITRERVRQIKKNALKKLSQKSTPKITQLRSEIVAQIQKSGNALSQKTLINKFVKENLKDREHHVNAFVLLLHIIPSINMVKETPRSAKFWTTLSPKKITSPILKTINWAEKVLQDSNKTLSLDQLIRKAKRAKIDINLIAAACDISKNIMPDRDGNFGLRHWPHVNPRNTRDKIHYILAELEKPLHFRIITQHIHNRSFEGKKPAPATVHNELIADKRFVLIGKGIYALRVWGFKPGTVVDVIKELLASAKKQGLAEEEIIKEVLKARQVSKNTILMNLQIQPEFEKTEEELWRLKK